MAKFGKTSLSRLETCDKRLRDVLNEAIQHYDFSVVCGHRDKEAQNRAYEEGNSQRQWPKSKHNTSPSLAVDVIPYPTGYEDVDEFYIMASYILAAAIKLNVKIKWGGHWRTFKDYPHFELG